MCPAVVQAKSHLAFPNKNSRIALAYLAFGVTPFCRQLFPDWDTTKYSPAYGWLAIFFYELLILWSEYVYTPDIKRVKYECNSE